MVSHAQHSGGKVDLCDFFEASLSYKRKKKIPVQWLNQHLLIS